MRYVQSPPKKTSLIIIQNSIWSYCDSDKKVVSMKWPSKLKTEPHLQTVILQLDILKHRSPPLVTVFTNTEHQVIVIRQMFYRSPDRKFK